MLQVDLRDIRRGPVVTEAEIPADDPMLEGLALQFVTSVTVTGRVQATDEGEYLWRGTISARVAGECRRCLKPVEQDVTVDADVLFSADPDAADDPSVYTLAASATAVELGQAVREELALAVSPFPLCREDCAGLCPGCGADLNAGPCGCTASAEPV
ncbi:MAG TPA: DUF177 domain-containing protein [Gemmatimonadales bacterium]|nr:DUF177 domain-containing protein [Gemmatimonadales bacterium]